MSATLTIGDQTYEVEVSEIEFTHDDYDEDIFSLSCNRRVKRPQISMSGFVNEITIKENNMGYRDEPCEAVCKDAGYEGNNLVKRVKDLALTDDERLLRKYNVVFEDGTLSSTGTDLLLATLFENNKQAIVDKLKAVEKAEKK